MSERPEGAEPKTNPKEERYGSRRALAPRLNNVVWFIEQNPVLAGYGLKSKFYDLNQKLSTKRTDIPKSEEQDIPQECYTYPNQQYNQAVKRSLAEATYAAATYCLGQYSNLQDEARSMLAGANIDETTYGFVINFTYPLTRQAFTETSSLATNFEDPRVAAAFFALQWADYARAVWEFRSDEDLTVKCPCILVDRSGKPNLTNADTALGAGLGLIFCQEVLFIEEAAREMPVDADKTAKLLGQENAKLRVLLKQTIEDYDRVSTRLRQKNEELQAKLANAADEPVKTAAHEQPRASSAEIKPQKIISSLAPNEQVFIAKSRDRRRVLNLEVPSKGIKIFDPANPNHWMKIKGGRNGLRVSNSDSVLTRLTSTYYRRQENGVIHSAMEIVWNGAIITINPGRGTVDSIWYFGEYNTGAMIIQRTDNKAVKRITSKLEQTEGLKSQLEIGAKTDIGRSRQTNQDYIGYKLDEVSERSLFVLADGLNLHGESASKTAVNQTIDGYFTNPPGLIGAIDRLNYGIVKADEAIATEAKAAKDDPKESRQTTIVSLLILDNIREFLVAHVGDSRMYTLRNGSLKQQTEDDSWVMEQVRAGILSQKQAESHPRKNLITRSLGRSEAEHAGYIHYARGSVKKGDCYLLCSDGLTNMVSEPEIQHILETLNSQQAADRLIQKANEAGGGDNISVVVVRVQ
jgi:serine/threonine protein phosphatase PrpC